MFSDFREFDEQQKKKAPPTVYNPQGEVRQCNEGRYEFMFLESKDKTCILLEVQIPRFMDTSLVNVDLNPVYVRLDIKGKITQLKFDEEILVDKSKIQRSTTTGALLITMPKASISEVEARNMRIEMAKEEKKNEEKLRQLEKAQEEGREKQKEIDRRRQEEREQESKRVNDPEFIIRESKNKKEQEPPKRMFVPDFDESEVPPLE